MTCGYNGHKWWACDFDDGPCQHCGGTDHLRLPCAEKGAAWYNRRGSSLNKVKSAAMGVAWAPAPRKSNQLTAEDHSMGCRERGIRNEDGADGVKMKMENEEEEDREEWLITFD